MLKWVVAAGVMLALPTMASAQDAEAVAKVVGDAIAKGSELRLTDDKGRLVIVPANVLGYVEIGAEEARRVGFGAL